MVCRYTPVYQQDAPPSLLCLYPSLCRAVSRAPGSQRPGRYHVQAVPHASQYLEVRELLPVKQCGGPWASCWSPGSHPGHTLSISAHSPVPPDMSGAKRLGVSMLTDNALALECPWKQHKHILKPLPAFAGYCCSASSVSLLLAVFILASAPPMNNT